MIRRNICKLYVPQLHLSDQFVVGQRAVCNLEYVDVRALAVLQNAVVDGLLGNVRLILEVRVLSKQILDQRVQVFLNCVLVHHRLARRRLQ